MDVPQFKANFEMAATLGAFCLVMAAFMNSIEKSLEVFAHEKTWETQGLILMGQSQRERGSKLTRVLLYERVHFNLGVDMFSYVFLTKNNEK